MSTWTRVLWLELSAYVPVIAFDNDIDPTSLVTILLASTRSYALRVLIIPSMDVLPKILVVVSNPYITDPDFRVKTRFFSRPKEKRVKTPKNRPVGVRGVFFFFGRIRPFGGLSGVLRTPEYVPSRGLARAPLRYGISRSYLYKTRQELLSSKLHYVSHDSR